MKKPAHHIPRAKKINKKIDGVKIYELSKINKEFIERNNINKLAEDPEFTITAYLELNFFANLC